MQTININAYVNKCSTNKNMVQNNNKAALDFQEKFNNELKNTKVKDAEAKNSSVDKDNDKTPIKALEKLVEGIKEQINKLPEEEKTTDNAMLWQLIQAIGDMNNNLFQLISTSKETTKENLKVEELLHMLQSKLDTLTQGVKSNSSLELEQNTSIMDLFKKESDLLQLSLEKIQKKNPQEEAPNITSEAEIKGQLLELKDLIAVIKSKMSISDSDDKRINDRIVNMPLQKVVKASDRENFKAMLEESPVMGKEVYLKDEIKQEEVFLRGILKEDTDVPKYAAMGNKLASSVNTLGNFKDMVPIEADFKPVINKNNFVADIIKSVKYMELNEVKDLTVKVFPKELGEIVIKVVMDGAAMKAQLTTANKDTYNLLNSNMVELNQKLSESPIKIAEFNLNIYYGDTTFFSKDGSEQQQHGENSSKIIHKIEEDKQPIDKEIIDDRAVNLLA